MRAEISLDNEPNPIFFSENDYFFWKTKTMQNFRFLIDFGDYVRLRGQ